MGNGSIGVTQDNEYVSITFPIPHPLFTKNKTDVRGYVLKSIELRTSGGEEKARHNCCLENILQHPAEDAVKDLQCSN